MRTTALVLAFLTGVALPGAAMAQQPMASQPKVSDGVVRIGFLLDMSGIYADVTGPGSATAARMAVEDFGGKVLGMPIEVEVADHYNKPDVAGVKAREWFDQRNFDAILDVAATAPALAVTQVGKEKHKIVMLSGPGAVRLTNEACTPTSIHWAYDTYALATTTAGATVKAGGDSWYFLTADYAFGHELEADAAATVKEKGGKVLGSARAPIATPDFSSYLLQAQGSKAKVIGLANAGADFVNAVKQAGEFGIMQGGQQLAALLAYIGDIQALGLEKTQGMYLTEAFYWDMNDETRAFGKRYFERMKKMPNMSQAGTYSAVTHYLKAVQKAGTDETDAVLKALREMPVNDVFARGGKVREDGRMVHDMYLFQVKKPAESKDPWDLYKLVATIPGDEAFQPLSKSRCPLVKK